MRKLLIAFFLTLFAVTAIRAENIDLVTLPARDGVQLTIYNSEDITLAKETRTIAFKKGANRLQFSWTNTLIDPTSVELRVLEHKSEIELVDTVFPGEKPQHLFWNIESAYEGQAKVEVSYFTSGITWQMDYVAVCNPEETEMKFKGYVTVVNNSGEDYEYAQIRLIVGKINLVEKIADLARQRGLDLEEMAKDKLNRLRNEIVQEAFGEAEDSDQPLDNNTLGKLGIGGGRGAKKIVKEGLSEYFMFSVESSETVSNRWQKRMIAMKSDTTKFDIVYRMRDYQYGPRPVRFFIWNNDDEHGLGESPLPNGIVRVFRENGSDGLSYLGETKLDYVPIKADIEVNLGPDDLVVYECWKMKAERYNFHFYQTRNPRVDGWDEKQEWKDTVRNYRSKPIKFELRRIWRGDVEYSADLKGELFDFQTVETIFTVEPRGRKDLKANALFKNGSNRKQNRILLK